MTTTSLSATAGLGSAGTLTGAANAAKAEPAGQDRFLKMLVAQMQNQDPLHPMDNAQVTSQMAQINAVTGIERVNGNLQSLLAQMAQSQALNSAALVGRDVLVEGHSLHLDDAGSGRAAFELKGRAERVTVEVLGSAGQRLDSFELGPLDEGRHHFSWQAGGRAPAGTAVNYRVAAASGHAAVAVSTYARETVRAVSPGATGLELDLAGGRTISSSKVRSIA